MEQFDDTVVNQSENPETRGIRTGSYFYLMLQKSCVTLEETMRQNILGTIRA